MKKKILTIATLLVVALIIGILGTTVMAADLAGATAEDATQDDTRLDAGVKISSNESKINGDKQNIEVVYTVASLKVLGTNEEDRPDGYGWIGVKVTCPEGAKKGIENDKDKTEYNAPSFNQYFGINVAKLQKAVEDGTGYISYTKSYTWQYDAEPKGVTTTTLTVKIKAEGVTLQDKDDSVSADKTLWNKDEYVTYKLEVLAEELKEQGLSQKDIEERLQIAEELLADHDLTIQELKAKLAELTEEKEEPTSTETPAKKDDTPKMGTIDVALITSVVAIVSAAGIVAVKRYSK